MKRVAVALMIVSVAGASAALSHSAAAFSSGSSLRQRFFYSPSGNINCEIDVGKGVSQAYCQTGRPPQNAVLYPDGRVKVCHGRSRGDCLGNPPDNARMLAYGRHVDLGPFRCVSLRIGMRCEATPVGHGFLISRSGVKRF